MQALRDLRVLEEQRSQQFNQNQNERLLTGSRRTFTQQQRDEARALDEQIRRMQPKLKITKGIACRFTLDQFNENQFERSVLQPMTEKCPHCSAYYSKNECNTKNQFTRCCMLGKIKLPPIGPPSPLMQDLFKGVVYTLLETYWIYT